MDQEDGSAEHLKVVLMGYATILERVLAYVSWQKKSLSLINSLKGKKYEQMGYEEKRGEEGLSDYPIPQLTLTGTENVGDSLLFALICPVR